MKKLLYYNSFVTVSIFFTRIFTYVNYSTSQTVKYLTTENSSNIQNVLNQRSLIICEGEIDALTWLSVLNDESNYGVVSVPNGAPQGVSQSQKSPDEDVKYKYV